MLSLIHISLFNTCIKFWLQSPFTEPCLFTPILTFSASRSTWLQDFRRTVHPRNYAVLSLRADWRFLRRFQDGQNHSVCGYLRFHWTRVFHIDSHPATWKIVRDLHPVWTGIRARWHIPMLLDLSHVAGLTGQLGVSKVHLALKLKLSGRFPRYYHGWTNKINPKHLYHYNTPPQWEIFCRNRRNLIANTPKRTGEDLVPTTPHLFVYFMGKQPPWLGDYGRIWTRLLDFSVRDPNTEKSNRYTPQRTSPSIMLCLLYTSRCV